MQKIHVLVEGQTEERFVKDIIYPFLKKHNIHINVTLLRTKVTSTGRPVKGGIGTYYNLNQHINSLLSDTSVIAVTTMVDFYAICGDFPGKNEKPESNCYKQVEKLETDWAKDINNSKFIPYLQLHEFEALLFSDTAIMSEYLGGHLASLDKIVSSVNTPEEINNGPTTHPSKRILVLAPDYKKRLGGTIISARIGLESIKAKCPHFSQWLDKILNSAKKTKS